MRSGPGRYESGVGDLGVDRMSQVKGASCTKLGEQERCDGLFQVEGSEQRTRGGTWRTLERWMAETRSCLASQAMAGCLDVCSLKRQPKGFNQGSDSLRSGL